MFLFGFYNLVPKIKAIILLRKIVAVRKLSSSADENARPSSVLFKEVAFNSSSRCVPVQLFILTFFLKDVVIT